MNISLRKDNKERIPFTHYLEEFQALDPETASLAFWNSYDKEKKSSVSGCWAKSFSSPGRTFAVRRADESDTQYAAILEGVPAKIMAIRMIANGVSAAPTGKYLTYREVPWGTVYLQQFTGRCISRLAFPYGNRLADFCAVMERMGAKKLTMGDASYEFEFINGYFVQFILWAGDDEFPTICSDPFLR
ncbi:MAG: DUF3786 domain-containing protein [Lachnospiraceae bacterium]